MIIRQATANDLVGIATLHRSSILELCKRHYSIEHLAEWTSALHAAAYSALLDTHEVLVAEREGELLGFGVLDPRESLINATYVSPMALRRGVGRRLVTTMEALARSNGRSRVRLNATLNAVPFYEELGYTSHGAATNRLPSGVDLPCVVMEKILVELA